MSDGPSPHTELGSCVPVTTLSHMMDCQFHGLRAGWHHLTNVILHCATAVLLFLVLREMTGAMWRSAFVAAVFSIHPLRVESVAWVIERKDVLSGLFFMLTLWAYVRYARGSRPRASYLMMLVWFALGLMSKPMLVTTPFVLMLLDYWPLGRLKRRSQFAGLLREKSPLFAMSILSSMEEMRAARGAIQTIHHLPVIQRLGNAAISSVVYLKKFVYPSGLAVFYPLPEQGWAGWQIAGAFLLLAALTAGGWALRRRAPYVLVGWLWYLGMLVPVSGILQAGMQAYADRFTYLPQIGLCISGTWAAAEWAGEARTRRITLSGIAVVVVAGLTVAAFRQAGYWRDSLSLWTHSLACVPDNCQTRFTLGEALDEQGRTKEAMTQYRRALQLTPDYVDAIDNLGLDLAREGRAGEAMDEYQEALQVDPNAVFAHIYFGDALAQQGRQVEAIAEFREALRINPDDANVHNNLGLALARQGESAEAISEMRIALELQPASLPHQNNLAWMLATAPDLSLRNGREALDLAMKANQETGGNNLSVLHTLAAAYAETGDFARAAETAEQALEIADRQSDTAMADELRRELMLYQAGHRYEREQ